MTTRLEAQQLDHDDVLAPLRDLFSLPDGVIYLDGNSLGALPAATADRVSKTVTNEWGTGLIRSWNEAEWIELPSRVADKIATLIGAGPDEVAVADSTSVNLFKVLTGAAHITQVQRAHSRGAQIHGAQMRRSAAVILSERDNFPTDLYIAESVAAASGLQLELCDASAIERRLLDSTAEPVAVLMLTHVNYRTGAMHDMAGLTSIAHHAGALTVWDLAHSAGAVELDVRGCNADFAVGCGYKYLNGGPGAPAFVWVHPRLIDAVTQPLSGWMGHAAPFDFNRTYEPASGVTKFLCGTPAVLALVALDAGVDTLRAAGRYGGMVALRAKSIALADLFISLIQPVCEAHDMQIVTPLDPALRGSQVSLAHAEHGYAIIQALIARGVLGDFRAPDIIRFGLTPLYTRFIDVYEACQQLEAVLTSGEWRADRFNRRARVT